VKSNARQLIATVISDARARVLLRAAPANLPPACHTSLILMGNCPLSLALGRLVTQKFGMGEADYRRRGCRIIKNRRSSAIDLTIMGGRSNTPIRNASFLGHARNRMHGARHRVAHDFITVKSLPPNRAHSRIIPLTRQFKLRTPWLP
jgi:hypothetical protein